MDSDPKTAERLELASPSPSQPVMELRGSLPFPQECKTVPEIPWGIWSFGISPMLPGQPQGAQWDSHSERSEVQKLFPEFCPRASQGYPGSTNHPAGILPASHPWQLLKIPAQKLTFPLETEHRRHRKRLRGTGSTQDTPHRRRVCPGSGEWPCKKCIYLFVISFLFARGTFQ